MERTAAGGRSPPLLKLTLYRLLFVGLTAGLGSWKAVAASRNQAITTNTLDWVIGVVLTLIWSALGGLSKRVSASTTYAWFFEFNYTPCILGSLRLLAGSIFFTVKMTFYAVLLLGGCMAPMLFVLAKPIERRPGFKGFFAVLASLMGTIYLSICCILATIKLSTSNSPVFGFPHDPFLPFNDNQIYEGNPRASCGNRHRKSLMLFRIIVFTMNILAAIFCSGYVIFLAASFGSR